jgi:hypothetical protein
MAEPYFLSHLRKIWSRAKIKKTNERSAEQSRRANSIRPPFSALFLTGEAPSSRKSQQPKVAMFLTGEYIDTLCGFVFLERGVDSYFLRGADSSAVVECVPEREKTNPTKKKNKSQKKGGMRQQQLSDKSYKQTKIFFFFL